MIARALADLRPGSAVLDLGCGTGRFSKILKEQGYKLFSADFSWDMVRYIKRRLKNGFPGDDRVVCADSSRLPFKDKSLDGIVSFRFLFHHMEDGLFEATLAEGARVCRRIILFDVRLRRTLLDPLLAVFGKDTKDGRPLEEMIRRTEAAGLIVDKTVYVNRYLSRKAVFLCRIPS